MWHPAARMRSLLRPELVLVRLEPENGSSASGTARLSFVGRRVLRVRLLVSRLRPLSRHPAHIHLGRCGSGGPIAFPLTPLVADRRGVAAGVTTIRGVPAIPRTGWYINVHRGPTLAGMGATPIACGDVRPGRTVTYGGGQPDADELRAFLPAAPAEPEAEPEAGAAAVPEAQAASGPAAGAGGESSGPEGGA